MKKNYTFFTVSTVIIIGVICYYFYAVKTDSINEIDMNSEISADLEKGTLSTDEVRLYQKVRLYSLIKSLNVETGNKLTDQEIKNKVVQWDKDRDTPQKTTTNIANSIVFLEAEKLSQSKKPEDIKEAIRLLKSIQVNSPEWREKLVKSYLKMLENDGN